MKFNNFKNQCKDLFNEINEILEENKVIFDVQFGTTFGNENYTRINAFESYLPDQGLIYDELRIKRDDNTTEYSFNIGRFDYSASFNHNTNKVECLKAKLFMNGMYYCVYSEHKKQITQKTFLNNLKKLKRKINEHISKVKRLRPDLFNLAEV